MPRDPLLARIDALEDELEDLKTNQGKLSRRLERLYAEGSEMGLSRADVDAALSEALDARMSELAAELTAEDDTGKSGETDTEEARKRKTAADHIRQREGRKAEDRKQGERDDDDGKDEDEGKGKREAKATEDEGEHDAESTPPEDEAPSDDGGFFSRRVTHGLW